MIEQKIMLVGFITVAVFLSVYVFIMMVKINNINKD